MNSDDPASLELISLMNMTSEVSFMSSFDSEYGAFSYGYDRVAGQVSVDSPRGLEAWAEIFGDEESSASGLPNSCSHAQECTLPNSPDTSLPSFLSSQPSIPPLATQISRKSGNGLKAKREKARAETLLRMLGVENIVPPNSGAAAASTTARVPNVVPPPRSRSRERKIRNRASVQRCRAKKMERFEDMENERKMLREENRALEGALERIAQVEAMHLYMKTSS